MTQDPKKKKKKPHQTCIACMMRLARIYMCVCTRTRISVHVWVLVQLSNIFQVHNEYWFSNCACLTG